MQEQILLSHVVEQTVCAYLPPRVEVVEVMVEQGYATSPVDWLPGGIF